MSIDPTGFRRKDQFFFHRELVLQLLSIISPQEVLATTSRATLNAKGSPSLLGFVLCSPWPGDLF